MGNFSVLFQQLLKKKGVTQTEVAAAVKTDRKGKGTVPTHKGYAQWTISPLQRTVQASESLLSRILSLTEVVSPPFSLGPFYLKNQSRILTCVSGDDSYELATRMAQTKSALSEMHIAC